MAMYQNKDAELFSALPGTAQEISERTGRTRTGVAQRLSKLKKQGKIKNRNYVWFVHEIDYILYNLPSVGNLTPTPVGEELDWEVPTEEQMKSFVENEPIRMTVAKFIAYSKYLNK